ncbi:MAG: hypothetical protein PWQ06_2740 [Anaerophaga sp.]|nr:hypothetical protein [Anaerophaga sp.]
MIKQDITNLLTDYIRLNSINSFQEFKAHEAILYLYVHIKKDRFKSTDEAKKFLLSLNEVNAILDFFGIINPDAKIDYVNIANQTYNIMAKNFLTITKISAIAYEILNGKV